MKKLLMTLVLTTIVMSVSAQFVKQQGEGQKPQKEMDWYNCSFEEDGVYGVAANRAKEFLKDKPVKKSPIVAIIGGGVDIEHVGFAESVWVNPKEKKDGKDNNKNGLIDDINGWNFIGSRDGSGMMESQNKEGDREWLRLKDKYFGIIFDGKGYFRYDDNGKRQPVKVEDPDEFEYFRLLTKESDIANKHGAMIVNQIMKEYVFQLDDEIRSRITDREILLQDLVPIYNESVGKDSLKSIALQLLFVGKSISPRNDWAYYYEPWASGRSLEKATTTYNETLAKSLLDPRKDIVGDNPHDIKDTKYGNGNVFTDNSVGGTFSAGVIAGSPAAPMGNTGIAPNARIMPLVVSTKSGEPYLKDIALAIRYAVDNGADVILLAQQNTLYPEMQKKWMSDAIAYAESKGVLVIVPVWDMMQDLSEITYYPNRKMDSRKEFTNLMSVAASDSQGNPSKVSNYSKEYLDIYAPGVSIYSTYLGDSYQMGSGAMLSAATLAGVAALVKTYYPSLTGSQIRNILIENPTSRLGIEVEKSVRVGNSNAVDMFTFDMLCRAGGIVNAYNAVKAADAMSARK